MDLRNKKSICCDRLNTEASKNIALYVTKPLSYLVHKCIKTGIFPDCIEKSIKMPIYKSGTKTSGKNYKPVI